MFVEGKLSGQPVKMRFNSGDPKPTCAACNVLLDRPEHTQIKLKERLQALFSYFDKEYFIFETKSGYSVVYCSKECRDQHNHRFVKNNK
jgi:hypothetical protein